MTLQNRLGDRLRSGGVALGLGSMYPSSGIVESMAVGWDFVWLDLQHGQHTYESVLHAVQAARAAGVDSMIRVPANDFAEVGRCADLLTAAIMVPMVDDADQARRFVEALHFPPTGRRSFGGRRSVDLCGRRYHQTWRTLAIAQIESPEAVEHAHAIASVEGIDAVFVGADDLKVRAAIPIDADVWQEATIARDLASVARTARAAGKAAGMVATTRDVFQKGIEHGYRLFVCGSDSGFIARGSRRLLDEFREAAGQKIIPVA